MRKLRKYRRLRDARSRPLVPHQYWRRVRHGSYKETATTERGVLALDCVACSAASAPRSLWLGPARAGSGRRVFQPRRSMVGPRDSSRRGPRGTQRAAPKSKCAFAFDFGWIAARPSAGARAARHGIRSATGMTALASRSTCNTVLPPSTLRPITSCGRSAKELLDAFGEGRADDHGPDLREPCLETGEHELGDSRRIVAHEQLAIARVRQPVVGPVRTKQGVALEEADELLTVQRQIR